MALHSQSQEASKDRFAVAPVQFGCSLAWSGSSGPGFSSDGSSGKEGFLSVLSDQKGTVPVPV